MCKEDDKELQKRQTKTSPTQHRAGGTGGAWGWSLQVEPAGGACGWSLRGHKRAQHHSRSFLSAESLPLVRE